MYAAKHHPRVPPDVIQIGAFIKMKIFKTICYLLLVICIAGFAVRAQETFTGTVVSYGSGFNTRMDTAPFTIRLKSETPADQAAHFLSLLQDSGQDALLKAISKEDIGNFSVGGNLARTVNAAVETNANGQRRIYIVFERWTRFAEVRGGYRSLDYPFGYIELNIDPRTGKGEGTYIAAAKIRWKRDKDASGSHVEIEDFATFPARLLNVRTSPRKP